MGASVDGNSCATSGDSLRGRKARGCNRSFLLRVVRALTSLNRHIIIVTVIRRTI
jgi:hypothetical protein